MIKEKKLVHDFLEKYGMSASLITFSEGVSDFIGEMEKGLSSKSSIPMLPTYLSTDCVNIKNEKVVVIDAGGTNFRTAVVEFDENGKSSILSFKKHKMPGTDKEISADEFFSKMAELVAPNINESDKIGFCFSYALEMTPDKDGKIITLSKEVKVKDAAGRAVGEGLLNALNVKGKSIVMLNDTVAALLAGAAAFPERSFSSYVGFILGTGMNMAYVEKSSSITKNPQIAARNGNMIINTESACFNGIIGGDIDKALNLSTKKPGEAIFEKMASGAYLGMNLVFALKTAANEGMFSSRFAESVNKYTYVDSVHLNDFLERPFASGIFQDLCETDGDRLLVYYFAEQVIERAAKLAAICIAAAVVKCGGGRDPLMPVCVVAEGSTLYRARFLKSRTEYYLKKHMHDEMELYADIVQVDDATITGSAVAGLL